MLDWALAYAERGWYVFPVHGITPEGGCTCGMPHGPESKEGERDKGKHPVLRNGVKGASIDVEKIRGWWGAEEGKFWNIGLRTGEISGLTVLDVDVADGKLGGDTWAALTAEKGEPDTLMATTGSGGAHVFFSYNSSLNTSSNTLGSGVDCRNDGGYVVAAPSRHRSGGVYSWVNWDGGQLLGLPAHLSKRVETRGRKKGESHKHRKYTVDQVGEMLDHIPADDRDLWRSVGIVLGREFVRSDEAWELYARWSATWGGPKGRGHDEIMRQAFYDISMQQPDGNSLSMGTLIGKAVDGGWVPDKGTLDKDKFIFYSPGNNFMYRPTGTFWVAEAVNATVGQINDNGNLVKASGWLQKNAMASSMTKDPSFPEDYLRDHDVRNGKIFPSPGAAVINTYQGPDIELGDARLAGPFLNHVARVFPCEGDAEQFLNYMAHRVQRPEVKPRFALMLAGEQGTGKDTAVEFCIPAIGPWNVANIEPSTLDTHYNTFAAATLVRISEAANLQDMSKWAFNERIKVLIAGNPDNVTINPKYGHQYEVAMFCGVVITTNHLMSGIYIPPGDRRYDVIASATLAEMELEDEERRKEYFGDLWDWFGLGGSSHVAAFLTERDLSKWSATNGQRKTEAHMNVVLAGLTSEHWLLDAMQVLGDPEVVRADVIANIVERDGMLSRPEIAKRLPTAMTRMGYYAVRNPDRSDGRWSFEEGKKTVVFAKNGVMLKDVQKVLPKLKAKF